MKMQVQDYRQELRLAVAEAREAGLRAEADKLEDAAWTACTTSSELLAVQGEAILIFLRSTKGRLPAQARRRLDVCLHEIGKVWPRLARSGR